MTFVPEVNMESLKAFLEKAEKKAVKYGMKFSYSIGEPEIREVLMEGNMTGSTSWKRTGNSACILFHGNDKLNFQILIPVCRI